MEKLTILTLSQPMHTLCKYTIIFIPVPKYQLINCHLLSSFTLHRADCIRSITTVIAGIIILVDNTKEDSVDGIAGAVASCTIAVGAILGFWEWIANLRDRLEAEKAREYMLDGPDGDDVEKRDAEMKAEFEKRSTAFSNESSRA